MSIPRRKRVNIQAAKKLISGIRSYWPGDVDVVTFNCDMLLVDREGNCLRIQMTGVPPGDLVDLKINDYPMVTYKQD